jgi:hypothetical protein
VSATAPTVLQTPGARGTIGDAPAECAAHDGVAEVIRYLGRIDYQQTWREMASFTTRRIEQTADQLWCCEHWPVLTLGQAGKPEHLLVDSGIPPVRTDRGGPITHHGPGVNSGQKPRKSGGAKKSGTITACLEPGQGRAPAGAANPLRGGRIR